MATTDEVLREYGKRIRQLDSELNPNSWEPYQMNDEQNRRLNNILRDLLLLLGSNAGSLACEVTEEYLELRNKACWVMD